MSQNEPSEFDHYVFAKHVQDDRWHKIAGFQLVEDAVVFKAATTDRGYEYHIGQEPPAQN